MSNREKELCNSGKELIENFHDIDNLTYKIENNMIQIYSFNTRYDYDKEEFKDVDTRILIPKKKKVRKCWKMQF